MTHAILFTAWARPEVLKRTLASWDEVHDIQDWAWCFRIEPNVQEDAVTRIIKEFIARNELPMFEIIHNQRVLGVLHHPWVGFEALFHDFQFVVRAEDDLCVSDDVLGYFTRMEKQYRNDPRVATIHAYTDGESVEPEGHELRPEFNSWVWGTWRDRWKQIIGPTWDHDYSTFNVSPGFQSGWDWNLSTRIFPQHELFGVYPMMSRVDNIGIWGVHGTPGNFRTASTFRQVFDIF